MGTKLKHLLRRLLATGREQNLIFMNFVTIRGLAAGRCSTFRRLRPNPLLLSCHLNWFLGAVRAASRDDNFFCMEYFVSVLVGL